MTPTPGNAPERPGLGIAYMLASVTTFSCLDALAKWLINEMPTPQYMAIRSLMVMLLVLPMIARSGGVPAVRSRRPWLHVARVVLTVGALACFLEALRLMPLATVVAIGFTAPLFMTALSVPMLGERVGVHRWSAIVAGFAGVLVITEPGGDDMVAAAAILATVASFCFALQQVITRILVRTDTDVAIVGWQTLGMLLCTAAVAPFGWRAIGWLELAGVAACALLVLASQNFGIRALRHAPVGLIAPFQYLELLWAASVGYLIWNELPGANVWIGAGIVVCSGLYVIWRETVRRRRS